ncbi:hypothetical protein B9R42_25625 [Arthrospira platensis PCC 7345]
MTMNIFAPNLYLCAYHLREDDTEGETHPLWSNCDRLLSHLTETRLIPHLHEGENRILLPPPDKQISFTLTDSNDIEGFIQPVQLQEDSYGVFLNIGYDDSDTTNLVEIPILEQLNPNQILPFPPSPYFLGQTLLLTLNLTPENQDLQGSELTKLANQCYQALFNQKADPSRSRELFGSPIFEYGNPREPDKYPHVLIWLFRDELADQTLQKNQCFSSIFDLFFYRHKVSKAFQDSREIYQQLKQYYLSLDPTLDQIQAQIDSAKPDPQDNTYLQDFKTQLKQLSADSLIYDRLLRKMKDLGTTIHINLNNYNDTIEQICAKLGIDKEELSLWRYFGEETGPYFRGQIAANLSYFEQGTGLISQAIASIRAIVEIDQAQCDRQRQEADAKYYQQQQDANQDLQNHIQAVGVGIAAGAIVASTSGLVTEPWERPDSDRFSLPYRHPFIIALVASIICAVGAWWVAEKLIKRVK